MKKFFIFLISLMMMFSLSSCETYTYATTQDGIYVDADANVVRSNVSFDIVIRYGIPYYMDGILLYYVYNNLYYYPFYYNNYWYVRAYRRPLIHFDRRPYFRPHRYDYRFKPGRYVGYGRNGINNHHNITPRRQSPNRHSGINNWYYNRNNGIDNSHNPPRRIDRNQNNHRRSGNMGKRR